MLQFRLARLSLILAAIGLNLAPALVGLAGHAQAADAAPAAAKPDAVRPEMFKLLDPAAFRELLTAKNYAEAQNRLDQASALPNPTPYETFALNRMRVTLAATSGNSAMAMTALEAVIESGRLAPAEKNDFMLALGNYQYNAKDYPKAIATYTRYQTESGNSAKVRPYLIRAYYFGNEPEKAKQALLEDMQANDKMATRPALEDLQLLANTGSKTKDKGTYLIALEKLVQYYPSDDYWNDLLSRTQAKPGFSTHLQLDFYRLERMAMKTMPAEDYVDMGELSLQSALPAEAKKVADAGFAAGVLGSGSNAPRQKKLRDQANKGAADDAKSIASGDASAAKSKDGIGQVNLGYAYVTMDQFDKGIDLIQKGIAKGGLKRPEDATLRLGEAYAMAGRKDEAAKTFATIKGSDGSGDLARYWGYYLNPPTAAAAVPAAAPAK